MCLKVCSKLVAFSLLKEKQYFTEVGTTQEVLSEGLSTTLPFLRPSSNSKKWLTQHLTQQPTTTNLSFSNTPFFFLLLLFIPLKAEKWDVAGSNSYSHTLLLTSPNCFQLMEIPDLHFYIFHSDSIQHFLRTPFEI